VPSPGPSFQPTPSPLLPVLTRLRLRRRESTSSEVQGAVYVTSFNENERWLAAKIISSGTHGKLATLLYASVINWLLWKLSETCCEFIISHIDSHCFTFRRSVLLLMKIWVSEHRNYIRNTFIRSVITEHRLQYNHDFNWNNIRILNEEPCFKKIKCLISRMFNIKNQTNSLSKETKDLHFIYQ